jgi:hypothetical protein
MFGFGYRFGAFGGGLNGAPDNTVAPVATATTLIVGGVLSTTNGTWTGSGITFSYQWYRGASPIGSATANTYTLVADDMFNNIYCQVTATNISGSAQANSNSLFAFEDLNDIFGANAYDWWDVTDDATLTKSGTRIDAIASKVTGSTRSMVASGSARPQVVTNQVNGLQVARFDGISEFMNVASSTALYNFLHNQASGGAVFVVSRITDADPDAVMSLLGNNNDNSANIGFNIRYDDRSANTRNNRIIQLIARGVVGNLTANNNSPDGFFDTQQFNALINIVDPNNGTADNRSKLSVNFGADIQNNVLTNAASTANASNNLTMGKNSVSALSFLKGDIAEIFIAQNQSTSGQLTRAENYYTYKYGTFPI